MMSVQLTSQPKKYFAQRFALWIALCSMFMAFGGLTSAMIVRRAQSDWLQFDLPSFFYISTFLVVLSSVTLILAHKNYNKDNFNKFRLFLITTFCLGVLFAVCQVKAWYQIEEIGVKIFGRGAVVSGSFMGVISWWHLLHLAGGLFFMLIAIIRSLYIFKQDPTRALLKDINPQKGIRMDLLSTYWHFVGILWVYLFLFFIVNK